MNNFKRGKSFSYPNSNKKVVVEEEDIDYDPAARVDLINQILSENCNQEQSSSGIGIGSGTGTNLSEEVDEAIN